MILWIFQSFGQEHESKQLLRRWVNCSRKGSAQILRITGFISSMPGAFEEFSDEIASNTSDASMTIELNWSVGDLILVIF